MKEKVEHFALSNPISVITGKPREEFTREDLINVVIEKQIERLTFHYTAMDGKLKELKIPVNNRRQVELMLTKGERIDGSSTFKGIVETGKSDVYIVPVFKTAFLNPFDEGSLDFMCRLVDKDGNRAWFAPDNILHNAHNLLKQNTGLELHALGELEFYLIGDFNNRLFPLQKQKGYHASQPFIKGGHVINEMLRYITQIFGNVKYAHSEVGYLEKVVSDFEELNGKTAEQFEIEFLPTDIEDAADSMVLASWIIRNVAFRNGFIATFFPKIEIGHAGNGLHVHMALMKDGQNVMTDDKGELSTEAKKLIGGLCEYAPSLTAFGNMVPASYLRLVPKQEAPTRVCWSEQNRSALLRIPLAWTKLGNLSKVVNPQQEEELEDEMKLQTVEIRSPDGSANAHLLMAALTMAAEYGLTHEKESLSMAKACYVSVDIHQTSVLENLEELATSCVESSEKLLKDKNLYEREGIFPSRLIEFIAAALNSENDRSLNHRLMALNQEERTYQSRRIMHRDMHRH